MEMLSVVHLSIQTHGKKANYVSSVSLGWKIILCVQEKIGSLAMPEKTELDIRPGMKIYYFISRSSKL